MTEPVATTSASQGQVSLEKLREIFPQFVTENTIDFDKLQKYFEREGLVSGNEKYGLNWAGRSHAFGAIRVPSTGTLVPQPEESKNWDDTENIFIEGDNLEVLKLLQKHYANPGKIKMIYIDPPYNTGKDFVYKDNFHQGVADYYEQTGQTQGGVKMTANTEKNGRYHSDWLTMMYPRLSLARNLLRDDGVIFVSIDDNEVANLRLIMDEIFGEENFIAQIVWLNKEGGGGSDSKNFKIKHEYILCYAKSVLNLNLLGIEVENDDDYGGQDEYFEKRGKYKLIKLSSMSLGYIESLDYPIEAPDGTLIYPNQGNKKIARWRWSKKKYDWGLKAGFVEFKKGSDGQWVVYTKQYFKVDNEDQPITRKLPPQAVIDEYSSTMASKQLEGVFGERKIFDYSKPFPIIKKLTSFVSDKTHDDIILDFFAGSGTTAHAVMDLNAEDGGNRKWICVQLPEVTDENSEAYKAGYKTIAEISRERIRRAGEKIGKGDVGFKSFKLSNSNYRKWNELTADDDTEKLLQQSKLFIENPLVDNYDERSVVYEILVKEGFDVNSLIKGPENNDKLPLWVVIDTGDRSRKLSVTFANKVTESDVAETGIGSTDNEIFVCFDNALDDTTKVNLGRKVSVKTI